MNLPFFKKSKKDPNIFTVAFYNVENLFDTHDDILTNDDDFLPKAEKRWTKKRYKKKLYKLATAISQIGKKRTGTAPALVGLAEVENKRVLEDLVDTGRLKEHGFDYVHYDSPDERGIDVALIYKRDEFKEISSRSISIDITVDPELPDFTRDILVVEGELLGEPINIIVNHWSSRREGVKETEHKRVTASNKVMELVNDIRLKEPDSKIIVMGDFNDDPSSKSVQQLTNKLDLFNPMKTLLSYTRGTLNHKFQWNIFDQILITTNFFETETGAFKFSKADIYDKDFLRQYKGKYKGHPFRTYVGRKYKGGYSDHFPVFIQLKKLRS
ncbi:MAG: endonuclease [Flavobacteriaceae bacterium]|nr:endonuclease [Bacteroidia bacterium]NNL60705.1 endonuclease [Flavobacteriaceae bacterium]